MAIDVAEAAVSPFLAVALVAQAIAADDDDAENMPLTLHATDCLCATCTLERDERAADPNSLESYTAIAYSTASSLAAGQLPDPVTFSAIADRRDRDEWIPTYVTELAALEAHGTYAIVPRPHLAEGKILGSKWVFVTKYDSDGNVKRRKARLVAQGF